MKIDYMIPGFDIVPPLYTHESSHQFLERYQVTKTKKFLATFMGTRYQVSTCSREALRVLDNRNDIIVRFHCYDSDKDCIQDEKLFRATNYSDILNTTFGFAPGGRSPATYRFMEYLVIGVIPIIIQDTPELIPLEGFIDFSNCALYTLTSQLENLVTKLRSMTPEEINSRQIECSFIYETYFRGNLYYPPHSYS